MRSEKLRVRSITSSVVVAILVLLLFMFLVGKQFAFGSSTKADSSSNAYTAYSGSDTVTQLASKWKYPLPDSYNVSAGDCSGDWQSCVNSSSATVLQDETTSKTILAGHSYRFLGSSARLEAGDKVVISGNNSMTGEYVVTGKQLLPLNSTTADILSQYSIQTCAGSGLSIVLLEKVEVFDKIMVKQYYNSWGL